MLTKTYAVKHLLSSDANKETRDKGSHCGEEGCEDDIDLGNKAQNHQNTVFGDAQNDSLIGGG